jgi:hypothetical protein
MFGGEFKPPRINKLVENYLAKWADLHELSLNSVAKNRGELIAEFIGHFEPF